MEYPRKVYRSRSSGRLISAAERIAAARTRVAVDRRRGIPTEPWIIELATRRV